MSDLDLPLAVRMMQDGYLMEIQDLKAENADLRREIALNEPLFETLNAANDALLAENAELRKHIEVLELHELGCGICKDEAVRQNAELRGLVRDMLRWMPCPKPCSRCERYKYPEGCEFEIRRQELGVDA